MPNSKSYHLETENISCELTIPYEPGKYPLELMFTAFGIHSTITLKPKELRRLIMFCDKHLELIKAKKT